MRYFRSSFIAIILMIGLLHSFRSHAGVPAARPDLTPSLKTATENLPLSIEENLKPVFSRATQFRDDAGYVRPAEQAILVSLPSAYAGWLRERIQTDAVAEFRIEASTRNQSVWIFHPQAPQHRPAFVRVAYDNLPVDDLAVDENQRTGCRITLMQTINSLDADQHTGHVTGRIEIEASDRLHYLFPFKASICFSGKKQFSIGEKPLSADITWLRPEIWTKGE